ncbi:hypothetical protein M3182_20085 [Mesobacillus maritimus]|uniref:hypothetical protein n=1 Tax=Mesobacillus maritimus TaxID=1643336 RepID=UPI00203CB578|nr:hypothetical protein [Mesobacillus maritimus]MCM3588007.1 hypothetical protein [Mesobacillus maritimus]MCM3668337.1 hypothetical protein [Mesobacillus maritimus]
MGIRAEKIYWLENPESGATMIATESEVKYENTIKDVFGVAFIEDLEKMISYNKKFREQICAARHITEKEISLGMVFRLATKDDLIPLKKEYLAQGEELTTNTITPPFSTTIELEEGLFNWDVKECSYVKMN